MPDLKCRSVCYKISGDSVMLNMFLVLLMIKKVPLLLPQPLHYMGNLPQRQASLVKHLFKLNLSLLFTFAHFLWITHTLTH